MVNNFQDSLQCYYSQVTRGLQGARNERLSYFQHWKKLADVYCPRRLRWFVTPNQANRGDQVNTNLVDETGVVAARTLKSGLMAGLTSPTRKWFRLGIDGVDSNPVKIWLAECETRLERVFAGSNFYQALGTFYGDVSVFASSAMIEYEDEETVVRFYNPAMGEFFLQASARLMVETLQREFTLTVSQVVEQFGLENCSETVQRLWKAGGASRLFEIIVCHVIEPNTDIYEGDKVFPKPVLDKFTYREAYWEYGRGQADPAGKFLKLSGFNERPFVAGRWDVTSNGPYGDSSPGIEAMAACNQLQIEQRRKAEAIDKLVRPPMVASVTMRNEPNSILPGNINYVADMAGAGFKPAFQVDPRLQEMNEDISEVQNRIETIFFVPLFMMISSLDTVRTATEIDARREEQFIQIGPVIERFLVEVLDPIIDRTFAIMQRRGLFPPPPPEIAGAPINIKYISMLAEAQRATGTTGIERLYAFVGNLAGVIPEALDKLNSDESIDEYADSLMVSPKNIRSADEVQAIRAQRAQAQQQAAAAQASLAAVEGAKTMSQTPVGGGQSALEAMISGG